MVLPKYLRGFWGAMKILATVFGVLTGIAWLVSVIEKQPFMAVIKRFIYLLLNFLIAPSPIWCIILLFVLIFILGYLFFKNEHRSKTITKKKIDPTEKRLSEDMYNFLIRCINKTSMSYDQLSKLNSVQLIQVMNDVLLNKEVQEYLNDEIGSYMKTKKYFDKNNKFTTEIVDYLRQYYLSSDRF